MEKFDTFEFIEPLLEINSGNIEKILTLWGDLNVEQKIFILNKFIKSKNKYSFFDEGYDNEHLIKRVLNHAFSDDSPYIRYLSAQEMHEKFIFHDDSEEISTSIKNDPSQLVRSVIFEDLVFSDDFYDLPFDDRVAMVRNLPATGKWFSEVTSKAADDGIFNNKTSERELNDVLFQYLTTLNNYLKKGSNYDREDRQLFDLVFKLPHSSSLIILKLLPYDCIPEKSDTLSKLDCMQTAYLLNRKDIGLRDFRRSIFFSDQKKYSEECLTPNDKWFALGGIKHYATCSNFHLSLDEFSKIIESPEDERQETLSYLRFSDSLELSQYVAIDYYYEEDYEYRRSWDDYLNFVKKIVKQRSDFYKEDGREYRFYDELKRMRLCQQALYSHNNQYEFLENYPTIDDVVKDDPWETFLAFNQLLYHDYSEIPKSAYEKEIEIDSNEKKHKALLTISDSHTESLSVLDVNIKHLEKEIKGIKNSLNVVFFAAIATFLLVLLLLVSSL